MRTRRWKTRTASALRAAAATKTVEEAIEQLVGRARSAAKTGYLVPHLIAPPYDPTPLAYSLGAKVVRAAQLQIEGQLVRDAGDIVLEYNRNASPQRQRFTIAHEVGHLLLWSATRRITSMPKRGMARGSEIETLCNKIAAEILAPCKEVRILWSQSKSDSSRRVDGILRLMRHFDISLNVAALRFLEVCLPGGGIALMNFEQGRFDWHYGIVEREWLSQLLLAKYRETAEWSGVGTYATGSGESMRRNGFEWERLNPRSCLVVVP